MKAQILRKTQVKSGEMETASKMKEQFALIETMTSTSID